MADLIVGYKSAKAEPIDTLDESASVLSHLCLASLFLYQPLEQKNLHHPFYPNL